MFKANRPWFCYQSSLISIFFDLILDRLFPCFTAADQERHPEKNEYQGAGDLVRRRGGEGPEHGATGNDRLRQMLGKERPKARQP